MFLSLELGHFFSASANLKKLKMPTNENGVTLQWFSQTKYTMDSGHGLSISVLEDTHNNFKDVCAGASLMAQW